MSLNSKIRYGKKSRDKLHLQEALRTLNCEEKTESSPLNWNLHPTTSHKKKSDARKKKTQASKPPSINHSQEEEELCQAFQTLSTKENIQPNLNDAKQQELKDFVAKKQEYFQKVSQEKLETEQVKSKESESNEFLSHLQMSFIMEQIKQIQQQIEEVIKNEDVPISTLKEELEEAFDELQKQVRSQPHSEIHLQQLQMAKNKILIEFPEEKPQDHPSLPKQTEKEEEEDDSFIRRPKKMISHNKSKRQEPRRTSSINYQPLLVALVAPKEEKSIPRPTESE